MNAAQRIVLVVGIAAVLGRGLWPPWVYIHTEWEGSWRVTPAHVTVVRPAGFSFIDDPPQVKSPDSGVRLDVAQLAMQEAIIVIATVMGVFLFKGRRDGCYRSK